MIIVRRQRYKLYAVCLILFCYAYTYTRFLNWFISPDIANRLDDLKRLHELWPSNTTTSDRILEQIFYLPSFADGYDFDPTDDNGDDDTEKTPLFKVLLIQGAGNWYVTKGRREFRSCPVAMYRNCILADDSVSDGPDADAVLFRNLVLKPQFHRHPDQIWVYYSLESPEHTMPLGEFANRINWTATYRIDSDIVTPYGKWVDLKSNPWGKELRKTSGYQPLDPSPINYLKEKKRSVTWFVSNCGAANDRLGYATDLGKFIDCPTRSRRLLARTRSVSRSIPSSWFLAGGKLQCQDKLSGLSPTLLLGRNSPAYVAGLRKTGQVNPEPTIRCPPFPANRTFRTLGLYKVDIYGMCGNNTCPRHVNRPGCDQKQYAFYLAFENSNCRDYITEKFFANAFNNLNVPIVMGGSRSDYARVAPPHSFIHVDEFVSISALAAYLHLLLASPDLYNAYFDWRTRGNFIDTLFWCRLCSMLNNNLVAPRSYLNQQTRTEVLTPRIARRASRWSQSTLTQSRRGLRQYYTDLQAWWQIPGEHICSSRPWEPKLNQSVAATTTLFDDNMRRNASSYVHIWQECPQDQ